MHIYAFKLKKKNHCDCKGVKREIISPIYVSSNSFKAFKIRSRKMKNIKKAQILQYNSGNNFSIIIQIK